MNRNMDPVSVPAGAAPAKAAAVESHSSVHHVQAGGATGTGHTARGAHHTSSAAVQQGPLPTTEKVVEKLDSMQHTLDTQPDSATKYGQRAIDDVQDVIEGAKRLLLEKNQDDLFQQLLLHVKLAAEEAKHKAKTEVKPALRDMRDDARTGAGSTTKILRRRSRDVTESLKSLVMTMVQSSEFRELIVNFIELFQNMVEQSMDRIQQHNPGRIVQPLNTIKGQTAPIKDMLNQGQQFAQDVSRQARDHAQNVTQQVKEHAQSVGQQAQQLRSDVTSEASRLNQQVRPELNQIGQKVQQTGAAAGISGDAGFDASTYGTAGYDAEMGTVPATVELTTVTATTYPAEASSFGGGEQLTDFEYTRGYKAYPTSYTYSTMSTITPPVYGSQYDSSSYAQQSAGYGSAQPAEMLADVKQNVGEVTDTARDVVQQTREAGSNVYNTTKHTASDVTFQTRQKASDLTHQTREVASGVQHQGRQFAHDMQSQAQHIKKDVQGAVMESASLATEVGKEVLQDFRQKGIPIDAAKRKELVSQFYVLWEKVMRNPDFNKAIDALFDIFDEFRSRASQLSSYAQAQMSGAQLPHMDAADLVWMDVREIISRWTGRQELDSFLMDVRDYGDLIRTDAELSGAFAQIRAFLEESFDDPTLLQRDEHQNRAAELIDQLLMQMQRWGQRDETDYLLSEFRSLMYSFKDDPTTRQFNEATKRLGEDLVLDSKGRINFHVTQDVLDEIRRLVVPMFLDQFASVPLPKIENSDAEFDFCVENVMFPGSAILPEQFVIKSKQHMVVSPNPHTPSQMTAKVNLSVRQLSADLQNIQFSFAKKKGIKMSDRGSLNVSFGGPRSKVAIHWIVAPHNGAARFETRKVLVRLDHVKIHINDAKHDLLLPMVTKMFAGVIKHRIEKAVAEAILEKTNMFNDRLNLMAMEAARAQRNLGHAADKLVDQASAKARVATKATKVWVGDVQEGMMDASIEARRRLRRAFRPGQGQNLKERARNAYSQMQSNVGNLSHKAQTVAQTALEGTEAAKLREANLLGPDYSPAMQPANSSNISSATTSTLFTPAYDANTPSLLDTAAPGLNTVPLQPTSGPIEKTTETTTRTYEAAF